MKGRLALASLLIIGMGIAVAGMATGNVGTASEGAATPRGTVTVEFDEWKIDTSVETVPAGRVTFEESNAGDEDHDLLVIRTDTPPDDLPMGLEGVSPEAAGEIVLGEIHDHEHGADLSAADHERHIHPEEGRRRAVTLEPGRYVLICPVPGHYERGQRTAITVR